MTVAIWINNTRLSKHALDWILSHTRWELKRWSQLDNILSRYSNETVMSNVDISSRCKSLAADVEVLGVNCNKEECCNFLAEQLKLLCTATKGRRYSIDILIYSFSIYHKSPACYTELRKLLCLPSKELLRDISSNISIGSGNVCQNYLKNKAARLQPNERMVNLQLDEIHIKSKVVYENGNVRGYAENKSMKEANRMQCFLISSLCSNNKDVVSIIPVQQMTAIYLCELIKQVIINVSNAGYRVISVISDNNVVNRNSFKMLANSDHLVPFITNPVNEEEKIFILFDSVHILKCIRNNWLNLKNSKKTFTFPKFNDDSVLLNASFCDLKTVYEIENSSTIKKAYRLSWKALHPHSIERQNVKLVLRIFNETNVAALKCLGPDNPDKLVNWNGTADFIECILKMWNMFNVKSASKGWHKRQGDSFPFNSCTDERLLWLTQFVEWLKKWKEYNDIHAEGFLTKETFLSLSHTVETIVMLIRYLLQECNMSYVLLGKFQTDQLESRFGHYRQLSGSNYLVSVQDVLHSEKKLKIKSLLKLYSASKGDITIRDYLGTFSDQKHEQCDINFVDSFPYDDITSQLKCDDLSALLVVTGYVAHKSMSHITCEECKQLFGDKNIPFDLDVDSKHLEYFDFLNRGGLTYPSNLLFTLLQCSYTIFNMCISEFNETAFLKVYNQKYTLIGTIERYLTSNDEFSGIYILCDNCDTECYILLMKAIGCFVNVLLNDYSIDKTDSVACAKVARKVAKFK